MSIERLEQPLGPEEREAEPELTIAEVGADDRESVAAYYQFEVDNRFSKVNPSTTFEKMVDFRQRQLREGKLRIATAKAGEQMVGTTVVVLESGTMGKEIGPTEAWAAGTLVAEDQRGKGVGERLADEQDRIALAAGKESIRTTITNTNFPSMRLRMNVGYRLEGIQPREDEVAYLYRKNLKAEPVEVVDWKAEVTAGTLAPVVGQISANSPSSLLVDPEHRDQVAAALAANFEGVYLLRREDFGDQSPIDRPYVVFRWRG